MNESGPTDPSVSRLAIHELVARYNMSWDSEDVDGVLACFSADGVFIDAAGGQHRGHDAIRAFVAASPAAFGKMRHITSSHLVEQLTDRTAQHRCYVVFVSHPAGERVLDTGEYDDAVELSEGAWRFTSRTVAFD